MFNKILTWGAILLTIVAFGLYWYFAGQLGISNKGSDWADFGSYVGGVFGVLAFLIVVYQNYQRDKEQKKQDFERTFFMMLEHHNNKLRFLEDKNNGIEDSSGSKESLVDYIYQIIKEEQSRFLYIRDLIEVNLYKEYSEINSYFLNLYRILKFINRNKELNVEKEYSSLLRSFLSKKILFILAYHLCNRDESYDDYIKYVNEFCFLEHMDIQDLEFDFIRMQFKECSFYNYRNKLKLTFEWFYSKNKIENYIDNKYLFSNYNEDFRKVKDDFYRGKMFSLIRHKRSSLPIDKNVFWSNLHIHKFSEVHLFIYVISTFDKAFDGNMKYKYIKNVYKNFSHELNNSPQIENKK